MKRNFICLALGFFLSLTLLFPPHILADNKEKNSPSFTAPEEYRIGPENVLQIDVYYGKEQKMLQKLKVSSRGFIIFPLLGEVEVAGLTVSEVGEKLTQLLEKDYLVNPQVSVFVEEYSNVSILGEVEKPGSYPIQGSLTIVELISQAGGFTKIASPNKVKIIRTLPGSAKQEMRVRVKDIINKEAQDIPLKAGDVVIVPESLF